MVTDDNHTGLARNIQALLLWITVNMGQCNADRCVIYGHDHPRSRPPIATIHAHCHHQNCTVRTEHLTLNHPGREKYSHSGTVSKHRLSKNTPKKANGSVLSKALSNCVVIIIVKAPSQGRYGELELVLQNDKCTFPSTFFGKVNQKKQSC